MNCAISWSEIFPTERKGIERLFQKARRIGSSFKNYNRIFRSEETMSFFEKLKNKIRILEFAIPFIPWLSFSGEKGLKKGLNRFFKDPRLHQIFSGEQELLGCLIPIGWSYFHDFQSPPKGGSQVIPQWLQYVIRYYENPVGLQCQVKEIFVEKGRATGLVFEQRGKAQPLKMQIYYRSLRY